MFEHRHPLGWQPLPRCLVAPVNHSGAPCQRGAAEVVQHSTIDRFIYQSIDGYADIFDPQVSKMSE